MLVVYDARNPGFRGEAKAEQQWKAVVASCRVPGLVRRVRWQRLMAAIADTQELAYLVGGMVEKYGLELDRPWGRAEGPGRTSDMPNLTRLTRGLKGRSRSGVADLAEAHERHLDDTFDP